MKKLNMNTLKQTLWVVAAFAGLALCACGGGGSSSGNQGSNSMGWDAKPAWTPAPSGSGSSGSSNNSSTPATGDNTVPVRVDTLTGNVNRLLASIKVCVPGTQAAPQCVTVDNMLVDTGSTGVRISARAIPTLAPLLLTQAGAVEEHRQHSTAPHGTT